MSRTHDDGSPRGGPPAAPSGDMAATAGDMAATAGDMAATAGDAAAAPGDKVYLVGMMGAGKTTVGRLLASRLGVAYLDSDAEILRRTGRTVPEIRRRDGDAAYRGEETAVLAAAAADPAPAVVAVAGGAVLDPGNRGVLEGGRVVWLGADPATLAVRVGDGAGRPLLEGDTAAALRRLDEVRRPVYAALAGQVVDVDDLDPAEIVDRILAGAGA